MVPTQQTIHAAQVLLPQGWAKNTRITTENGRIVNIQQGVNPTPSDECHEVILAGMPNLHSHAFQYGMAGLAEKRGPSADSFWSWRDIMYKFALNLSPEQAEAVALRLYVDMLEAGFTRVGEFHYLHHDRDGKFYNNIAEMADRIIAAAQQSGIGLTMLPVFYAHSTFGGAAPNDGQRRFINSTESFAKLIESCETSLKNFDGAVLGVAPHSLRAVTSEELRDITALLPDAPIHIHIAEQIKEVEDCLNWAGKRPVEWLLDNQDLDKNWCLIHATHMTDVETLDMANTGAIAGLCPITEANLGDGTFNAPQFSNAGGCFGIGSDSNILISIDQELRQLEYSQRLQHRARNVLANPQGSTGRFLYDAALKGGNIALGDSEQALSIGASADFISLNMARLPFAAEDTVLDGWIFAGRAAISDVWVRGEKLVQAGRHHLHDQAESAYQKVLGELISAGTL